MEIVARWNQLVVMSDDTQAAPLDPDAELMLRFKAGDLPAFELLFTRHARSLVNFAFRFVRNRDIAEEIVQEVFLRVHDAASTYRVEAKFTTWLYRIATNLCLNEVRRPQFKVIHQSLEEHSGADPDQRALDLQDHRLPSALNQLERASVALALKQALNLLPEKQRVAFVLNKFQDLSYAEVAEVMQTSEKAVKSLIHRAKEALAEELKPRLSGLL